MTQKQDFDVFLHFTVTNADGQLKLVIAVASCKRYISQGPSRSQSASLCLVLLNAVLVIIVVVATIRDDNF